jgi:hypothetical protein
VNTAKFWTQFAPQVDKDIDAAAPEFFAESRDGMIIAARDVGELNVGDGERFGVSYTYVKKISAEGAPKILGYLGVTAALCKAITGKDTKSGASDPYSHLMEMYETTEWQTFWGMISDRYEKFPNVKVLELLIEGDPDNGFLYVTPTLGFAARPSVVAAPVDAAQETVKIPWASGAGQWCVDGDYENILTTPKATDLTSAETLANALQAILASHYANVIAPHHQIADTAAHVATLAAVPAATNEATTVTLANAIKASFSTGHRSSAGVHYDDDTDHEVTTADSTNTATAIVLLNEIRADYLGHIGCIGSIKTFSIKISRAATEWQGEDIVNYDFPEGRGRVEASFTVLVKDHNRYNKLYYGATNPAAGTEVTDETFEGNFHLKFTAQESPERSIEITIPTLRYTDPGVLKPNADGGAPEATVAGVAGGGDSCIAILIKDGRATAY